MHVNGEATGTCVVTGDWCSKGTVSVKCRVEKWGLITRLVVFV